MNELAVNHHAGYRGCTGFAGTLAGISMLALGRSNAKLVTELARLTPQDQALDVGCGPGNAVRLAGATAARVTGVDPSAEMLRIASAVTGKARDISWLRGGAEDLPVPDASASVYWTVASVHHWPDVGAGLAEAHRVLRPGGRLLAVERWTRPGANGLRSHGWTLDQAEAFAALCREAGFAEVTTERIPRRRRSAVVVRAVRP